MTKNKKIGLALVITPPVLLFIVLFVYSIATFIVNSQTVAMTNSSLLQSANSTVTTFQVIRIVTGLLGTLAVMRIFVAVPIGIVFLLKKEPIEKTNTV